MNRRANVGKRCGRSRPIRAPRASLLVTAAGWLAASACASPDSEIDSAQRGDQAFALGDYEEALAEYRLALAQSGAEDIEMMLRVAHAYAASGRADEAARRYEALVKLAPQYGDQAVADLMHLADEASASGDRFAMARAAETALNIRPGLGLGPSPLELARHYFRNGEYDKSLPFYHTAIAEAPDSVPLVVFEVGRAHEEIGDCRNALPYFERFREMVGVRDRGEVDWFIGRCAFIRARELQQDDPDPEEALRLLDRVVAVGEPRSLVAEAWFRKGELLAETGRCDEAMAAYSQVESAEPSASLAARARSRYDLIRFGGGDPAIQSLRSGRCH